MKKMNKKDEEIQKQRDKATTEILKIMVEIERMYTQCHDKEFGTVDYERFGELVVEYLKKRGLKTFQ